MVREILHIQVGQCGNQVRYLFWQTVIDEHSIDGSGYYQGEKPMWTWIKSRCSWDLQEKYVPRACFIDLPGTVDVIKALLVCTLFMPGNFVYGAFRTGINWVIGHYTWGAKLIEETQDVVRKEVKNCDCPQGFQICHSLGGGTGSVLGTLVLLKLRVAYPDRISTTFSVYPSPKVSDPVVEPCNAVLSSHQLIDAQRFEDGCTKLSKLYIVSCVMAGVTASLRFPGRLNGDFRNLGVNLVTFTLLHFVLIARAPLALLLLVKELLCQCSARLMGST